MAFFPRKMLVVLLKPLNPLEKSSICLSCLPNNCPDDCDEYVPSDPYFPPPPPLSNVTNEKYHMPFYFILMICVLGGVFMFICYLIVLKRNRSNSRIRRNVSEFDENREDFVIDENLGPVLDHPIWYIRTVGLTQDVIDSISVFKYKKNESLIEGNNIDCSVCLTEFEDDESIRLLPKCSHAFHVPCIDTWLRSHKNCPLCRSPIVSDMDSSSPRMDHVVEVVSISTSDGDGDGDGTSTNGVDDHVENLELDEEGNEETRRGVDDDDEEEEEGRMRDLSMKVPRVLDGRRKGGRVLSDLVDHQHRGLQPARRSVSMDSSAAHQVIHLLAMNEMNSRKIEGCSSSKRGGGGGDHRNSSLYKAMKSSSFGRSLQKVPISMKRSFSTSGKSSLPTTSKVSMVSECASSRG